MATNARIGHDTTFNLIPADSPQTPVEIGEITNITPPNLSRDVVDATHMKSPDRWREYISALRDGGEISLELNYVPGSAGDTALHAAFDDDDAWTAQIVFPDTSEWECSVFVTNIEASVPNDDKMTTSATLKVTGKPIFTEA